MLGLSIALQKGSCFRPLKYDHMDSIAVIIPVFNEEKYIVQCLDSCILQTDLVEIITVDDGSTDQSVRIIKDYQEKDSRIQLYRHEKEQHLGVSASRNLGVSKATSEWITFLDADDYFLPNRFEELPALDREDIDGTYENVGSINESSNALHDEAEITGIFSPPPPDQLQDFLISNRDQRIVITGLIVRRVKMISSGLFDEQLTIGEDTDFIWRLARGNNLVPVIRRQPRIIRRLHDENVQL